MAVRSHHPVPAAVWPVEWRRIAERLILSGNVLCADKAAATAPICVSSRWSIWPRMKRDSTNPVLMPVTIKAKMTKMTDPKAKRPAIDWGARLLMRFRPGSWRRDQPIATTPFGRNHVMANLAAQPCNDNLDRVRIDIGVTFIDALDKTGAVDGHIFAQHQAL